MWLSLRWRHILRLHQRQITEIDFFLFIIEDNFLELSNEGVMQNFEYFDLILDFFCSTGVDD